MGQQIENKSLQEEPRNLTKEYENNLKHQSDQDQARPQNNESIEILEPPIINNVETSERDLETEKAPTPPAEDGLRKTPSKNEENLKEDNANQKDSFGTANEKPKESLVTTETMKNSFATADDQNKDSFVTTDGQNKTSAGTEEQREKDSLKTVEKTEKRKPQIS